MPKTRNELIGTWRLVSFEAKAEGKTGYPLGAKPGAFVGFTPTRLWAMIVDTARKPPAAPAPTEMEAQALMTSSAAYTGTYNVGAGPTPGEIELTVHVDAAANESLNGTERLFFLLAQGDRLTFRSAGDRTDNCRRVRVRESRLTQPASRSSCAGSG